MVFSLKMVDALDGQDFINVLAGVFVFRRSSLNYDDDHDDKALL